MARIGDNVFRYHGKTLPLSQVRFDLIKRGQYIEERITGALSSWAKKKNLRIPIGGVGENYGDPSMAGSKKALELFYLDVLHLNIGIAKEKLWKAGVRFENDATKQNELQENNIADALNIIFDAYVNSNKSLGTEPISLQELDILISVKNMPFDRYVQIIPFQTRKSLSEIVCKINTKYANKLKKEI